MKKLLCAFMLVSIMAAPALAGLKMTELMQDPEFAQADPIARLQMLDKKMVDKTIKTSDISGDLAARLYMDAIVDVTDPTARLDKYAQIMAGLEKMPTSYPLESHLLCEYLAKNPIAKQADLLTKLKLLLQLEEEKKISWPAAAPVYTGMITYHLVTNAEYQAMSNEDKLKYIKKLSDEGYVKDLSSSRFTKGVGLEILSATPVENQAATLTGLEPILDFFTKSMLSKGYVE